MNAEMKNGINLLMILVLFISCVQEKEDNNVLRRVEACMELFPDSALSLLSQIECPECMRGQQRADYALLLTQALDKNYLDNLQSDSLIMIAVEYYKQEGDKLKAGKAYFYYGKVMLLKERFSDAMQAYLEASSLLEETRDYKVQGMVWEYIGYLNSVQGLYENSIDNFNILSGTMNWRVTDVVFYMVIGIWQEAIFRYIIMIVQVGMLKKGLC